MKKILLTIVIGSALCLMLIPSSAQNTSTNLTWKPPANAQRAPMADPEVYLQGTYIEVGIAQSGSCGTFGPAPSGYHNFYGGLGFVADYGVDGWDVGTPPYSGDYFIPGTPEERWVLAWTYQTNKHIFNNSSLMYDVQIPQTSLTNTSSGTTNSCIWTGTAVSGVQSILVKQEVTFQDSDLYFIFNITLTNTGSVPLENIEYMRNVDPDQGVDVGCGYPTFNYVRNQPGWTGSGDTALVIAKTNGCNSIPLGLYAVNPNAVVSTEGFTNTDPAWILDNQDTYSEAFPNLADEAIALAFRFPTLAPGQSLSFSYAYILNEAAIITPPPINNVPVSNWALALMVGLIVIFTVIRFRRMN
jgi:hypothetical protein